MKLFIFGSTGDLVKRKVLSALQELQLKNLEVYAVGRKNFTDETYGEFACDENCSLSFKKSLKYIQINYDSDFICEECMAHLDEAGVNYFYLALPPKLYPKIIQSAANFIQQGYKIMLLVEKPLGENHSHFKEIYDLIKKEKLEKNIFLSDHYLFKNNIKELKKHNFSEIKIISTEKIGLEGRTNYYDSIGALKDMVQSHFLNILFRISEHPININDLEIVKYVRAQYNDYVKDLGRESGTETFIYLQLKEKSKNITLITGKSLDKKSFEIEIDGKKIKNEHENSYKHLFKDFFKGKKDNFPTLEETELSWKILELIKNKKTQLRYYKEGEKWEQIIN